MAFSKKQKQGFSLVELTTVFALVGLVSILVATLYFAHFKLFSTQNNSIEISSQNKLALNDITNQIRESQAIANTCSNCGADTTSATVVILQLWPLDANGEPLDPGAGNYDYIVYKRDQADNTKLIKKTVTDASSSRSSGSKILATQISNLQFTYDNADPTLAGEVTVSVSTTATSYGKSQTLTQSGKAVLRNK